MANDKEEPIDQNKDSSKPNTDTPIYGLGPSIVYVKDFLKDVLNLKKGVNVRTTISEIRDKNSMAGANSWMLMCSIVIASIGLSQNSQAVIIGAMLISPLMSPILGIGLSIGINDIEGLRKALAHFATAITIAIITSTLYFYIIDFGEITPEIQSRTRPTFLDIFVAIFGGIAGIISVARKDVSTTLPGVAIATALMPPLCVTGYGIANGNLDIAMRSFYLFFLNTFFVALATYLMIRFLNFPYKKYLKKSERRRNLSLILIFSSIGVIPSILIFNGVLKDISQAAALKNFEENCLGDSKVYLDSYQLFESKDKNIKTLYLKCYGDAININKKAEYETCLSGVGLKNVNIEIISSSDVNLDQLHDIEKNIEDISAQLNVVNEEKKRQAQLTEKYATTFVDSIQFIQIRDELKALYPNIQEVGMAKMHLSDFDQYYSAMSTILIKWDETSKIDMEINSIKLNAFLKERIKVDTLRIVNM